MGKADGEKSKGNFGEPEISVNDLLKKWGAKDMKGIHMTEGYDWTNEILQDKSSNDE